MKNRSSAAEVLVDLGTALVAFGDALQLAGRRLQQAPTPAVRDDPLPVHRPSEVARLPAEGFLRLHDIIGRPARRDRKAIPAIIPVSRATWYAGVKTGRFPKPVKSGRVSLWRVEEVRALVEKGRFVQGIEPDAFPTST